MSASAQPMRKECAPPVSAQRADRSGDEAAARQGCLWLMPNTLDLGLLPAEGPAPDLRQVLPQQALEVAAGLTHWVVENARSARALLKRVATLQPLVQPLQAQVIRELPRPRKGGERTAAALDARDWLAPALAGQDIGLMSEAGLPAVADPGAALVEAAHGLGLRVRPLSGPSSLMLALAASGLNGQSFTFVGYLPTDTQARAQRIRALEVASRQAGQTQLLIETPYRNSAMLAALLQTLQPATRLCVASGLTTAVEQIHTAEVARWRRGVAGLPTQLASDVPAVFLFLAR